MIPQFFCRRRLALLPKAIGITALSLFTFMPHALADTTEARVQLEFLTVGERFDEDRGGGRTDEPYLITYTKDSNGNVVEWYCPQRFLESASRNDIIRLERHRNFNSSEHRVRHGETLFVEVWDMDGRILDCNQEGFYNRFRGDDDRIAVYAFQSDGDAFVLHPNDGFTDDRDYVRIGSGNNRDFFITANQGCSCTYFLEGNIRIRRESDD